MSGNLLKIIFLFSCFTFSIEETIRQLSCGSKDPKNLCKITEIRINPCKEAEQNKPCVFKNGNNASIEIDVEALKPINTLKALPYAVVMRQEIKLPHISENACDFLECPFDVGTNQTYNFHIKVVKNLPRVGLFNVKLKFWDETKEGCCASFFIKLL